MYLPARLYILCLLFLALTACANAIPSAEGSTPSDGTPDSDAVKLIAMSAQAMQIAKKESLIVTLRQVDTDLTIIAFRFVDSALTKEIMVVIPASDAPTAKWSTVVNSVSPSLTQAGPALNLQRLRVGPNRVVQAITTHWPGCTVRGITLYPEDDKLTWVSFCNTPEGVVTESMDNEAGVFQPSDAPPAPIPLKATPIP